MNDDLLKNEKERISYYQRRHMELLKILSYGQKKEKFY